MLPQQRRQMRKREIQIKNKLTAREKRIIEQKKRESLLNREKKEKKN